MNSPKWRDRAACKDVSTFSFGVFFPNVNGPKRDKWDEAYAYCQVCPVRRQCLEMQLQATDAIDDTAGMFGGLTPRERKLFRRGVRNFVKETADGRLVTVDRFVGL